MGENLMEWTGKNVIVLLEIIINMFLFQTDLDDPCSIQVL